MAYKDIKPFLMKWIACFKPGVFSGIYGPKKLASSLSCERVGYDDLPDEDLRSVMKFRRLRHDARTAMARRALEDFRNDDH